MLNQRRFFMALCAGLLLGGCEDMFSRTPSRNFDELIPRMMGAVNNKTPEEAAINLFNVTSPDERRDAIAYLQTKPWGHQPPYMRAYEILITDPHPMVRAQAMRALGTSYQPGAGDFLVRGLKDTDEQVRRDAAYGLVSTWNEAAFAPLTVSLATDTDEQVRVFAARALAHARTPEAIRALISALSDKDAAVTQFAQQSLTQASGQNFSYDTKAWMNWYRQQYEAAAATATKPAG